MDDALMNVIPVIFSFSWIFSNNKNMDVASSNLILIIFAFSWIFFTKNMDFDSVNFIQLIFAVWIFLIDIASIKIIFAFSWIFYDKNIVPSSHKQQLNLLKQTEKPSNS